MQQFTYNKFCFGTKLESEIRASAITVALDYITTQGNTTTIHFKASLNEQEKAILDQIVEQHDGVVTYSYDPIEINLPKDSQGLPIFRPAPFSEANGFRFRGVGVQAIVPPNTTTNIDYKLEQERWINGGQLIVNNCGENDKFSFQVVDKDYIYAGQLYPENYNGLPWSIVQPNGVVLDEFIKDFFIPPVNKTLELSLSYPARIPKNLYLRLIYASTSNDSCVVKCNLFLHWRVNANS